MQLLNVFSEFLSIHCPRKWTSFLWKWHNFIPVDYGTSVKERFSKNGVAIKIDRYVLLKKGKIWKSVNSNFILFYDVMLYQIKLFFSYPITKKAMQFGQSKYFCKQEKTLLLTKCFERSVKRIWRGKKEKKMRFERKKVHKIQNIL